MTISGRIAVIVVVLAAVGAERAWSQDSEFGIKGLGTPGRPESVRSRSTGGALAAFDPTAALAEVALVDIETLTASTGVATSYRQVQGPATTTWLRNTRFPLLSLGGPVSKRLFLGGGFSSYLDRTYAVETRDSMSLRGRIQPYTDQIVSDGGVGDLRLGAALRVSSRFALGLGVHLLPGSTRETATRTFDDSTTYAPVRQSAQVRYQGLGFSASALFTLTPGLAIVAFGRNDTHLNRYVGDTLTATTDLPATIGGALRWSPVANAHIAGSVTWRSWSGAGANASNTLNWSAGLEVGSSAPLRVGVRGGQLPFGATQPYEWGVAVGAGRVFARGRGTFDLGLERLARDGGTLHERAWTALLGMTLRP